MTRPNKILIAVLTVLLLVLGVIAARIALQSGTFGSRDDLAQPYNETRYSGTLDNPEGLIDDAVPVDLVIRFHDKGETGELTSPTLKRYSTLTRIDGHTYREHIVHGDGENGIEWTFEPRNGVMSASYTTPDGTSGEGELPQTDPKAIAGEVGINPHARGGEPDGIEFPSDGLRELATIDYTYTDNSGKKETEEAVFRASLSGNLFTVTYPERGCYGVLAHVDNVTKTENFTVGDCASGGTWHFTGGDPSRGEADFTSADGSVTGKLRYHSTNWDDIDGEIGLSRSGPVLGFYRDFTSNAPTRPGSGEKHIEPALPR